MKANPTNAKKKARYVMLGGFLGAGKTTAVVKLARHLSGQGMRVGLITNDQGRNLVDTTMLRAQGFATEEIPGGCFCCRFNSLVEAATKLTEPTRPDVFIAEPVGSCTDLVATVSYPLRRMYGEDFTVAPVSVLVDPHRAARVFGVEPGRGFSDKVVYIYLKQLEEADLIVINKADLLAEEALHSLRQAIAAKFPSKEILTVSARTGLNLEEWFSRIAAGEQSESRVMEVDYEVYADGEARLGWLNGTVGLEAGTAFDANAFMHRLAEKIHSRLNEQGAEVAHLKATLSPEDNVTGEIAVVNLVRNDFVPELAQRVEDPVAAAQLIINLRAEAAPEVLAATVREALEAAAGVFPNLATNWEHLENFRPGKPTPTHRIQNSV